VSAVTHLVAAAAAAASIAGHARMNVWYVADAQLNVNDP
jgi:hypothetical protein